MIRHQVLVKFRDDVEQVEKQAIFKQLGDLKDRLDGITDYQTALNVSPETHVVHGFLDMFWFDFENAAARDAYLIAPDHIKAGQRLTAATKDGRNGLVVFDFEI